MSRENTMRQITVSGRGLALACAIMLCGMAEVHAQAQAQGDGMVGKAVARKQASEIAGAGPARWQRADGNRQAALKTSAPAPRDRWASAAPACARRARPGRTT
jgi:hypothetical protein